ncbi:hypothetical protein UFOVP1004_59 [uncultured Caudovirales phage]|uniref:Uncharacterized protein n=1 Tax=uncultured Caudovirales phage TaxID=2100421 RepID=A0A6J5QA16_9CAUD|nr:hypothetical protein UFOVP1004_59 [uncultured Caudovirales phage]
MNTAITHSMRISEANRLAEGYMNSRSQTRKNVLGLIEQRVERWSCGSLLTLEEQDANDLKSLLVRTFTEGFATGCRNVLGRLDRETT